MLRSLVGSEMCIRDSPDTSGYWGYFDSSAAITGTLSYPFDTIRVHIVSGYNFEDVTGFLLQIRALDTSGNFVDLANFTWARQVLGTDVLKFSPNTLLLGNRFYDKYVEFKVPSVQELGGDICLLYTSDAADDLRCVELGGRRIIKKKKQKKKQQHTTHPVSYTASTS